MALGLAIVVATAGGAAAATTTSGPAGATDPVVRTDAGAVRGTVGTSHRTFQGIPYAAPPVGQLRWAAPQPPAAWSGVRDATQPGNDCPQTDGFLGDPASDTEDCLYLNVTTPSHTDGRKLPVVFFVHGGGFYSGSARLYRADPMVDRGDVVVVTANYRLGVFGFLADPALGGDQSGNYGLQDQQAALRWVQRNIAAFGGDPRDVTLVGESAGSVSTCSQLAAPSSAGLFRRAVMQSGPCSVTTEWPYQDGGNWYPRPRAVAEQEGAALAQRVGCTDPGTEAACLRKVSPATLLEASAGGQGYGPVYGGGFLPIGPAQAIATGQFTRVPVVVGTTRDEHRMFVGAIELMSQHVATADDYRTEVESVLGTAAGQRVLAEYPLADYSSPSEALATVWTDRAWACPAMSTDRAFAQYVPTYAYEFADEQAPWTLGGAPSFPTGAFHASELQFLFDDEQFPGPATAAEKRLSNQMVDYWTTFAHSSDPNGPGTPEWSRYHGSTMVQSLSPDGIRPVDLSSEHRCGFWATIDG
ncbi:carboxylic ester hydrolase [Rugosimonospora africana]|uniref:Carboxylic ester hydrolase n=1 Tax=Rugosimonospora africana TaxID=556532 RepID=A0A8J3VQZ4_9ACTN|nr:carboxylic ester hydrolase [Rugosimonospora africana]